DASVVVRGADTGRLDLAPEAAGLLAVSLGISAAKDDHADLMQGMFLCDALYSSLRHASDETLN
ncbi:MAG: chromate resistance protein ChrB domain-containing protein, partial [Pseudomonadota bacterium]|nr:chromate resistance protein ChrB domain-containing protein [Pseudomonadota bacterium]